VCLSVEDASTHLLLISGEQFIQEESEGEELG